MLIVAWPGLQTLVVGQLEGCFDAGTSGPDLTAGVDELDAHAARRLLATVLAVLTRALNEQVPEQL